MKYKELCKAIDNLKENPQLVFNRTNLSKKELEQFHTDIADILMSLKEARSKLKAPTKENSPVNVGSTINAIIEETIQELRKKYLDPLRRTSNLKRTSSSFQIGINTTSNPVKDEQRPKKIRRCNSDESKIKVNALSSLGFMEDSRKQVAYIPPIKTSLIQANPSPNTVQVKAQEPLQKSNKLKRSHTTESAIGRSSKSSHLGRMQASKSLASAKAPLPKIPDSVQRDISFLQNIQPIFWTLDGNNQENRGENSQPNATSVQKLSKT